MVEINNFLTSAIIITKMFSMSGAGFETLTAAILIAKPS